MELLVLKVELAVEQVVWFKCKIVGCNILTL